MLGKLSGTIKLAVFRSKKLLEKWVTFLNEAYSLEKGNAPESLNEKEIEKAVKGDEE